MAEPVVVPVAAGYVRPHGDPGLFGPSSVAWRVHADFGPMLVGGISALLLQSLHPLVMQAVADHSNYQEDPFGRLGRTAEFIAGTTYGSTELAEALVARVRRIHEGVRGVAPDGREYRADDPSLLAYVHVTETLSFLAAHQRYSNRPLLLAEKDRYLCEMATVAKLLGAGDVPTTTVAVRAYLRRVRPELSAGPPALEALAFLTSPPQGRSLLQRSAYAAISEAAVDLLPPFARRLLGLWRPLGVHVGVIRPTAAVLTSYLRFSLGESPVLEAARRRTAA